LAREWYQKAAEAGNAAAMTNLGHLYEEGLGVAQDYTQARTWYEKAAVGGDCSAEFNLSRLNPKGLGQLEINAQRFRSNQSAL
jgi:TPR repeat protein